MRTLQVDERPTRLAQAIAEVGRIDKTIHTLTFIDDETRRRSTLQQLNLGEGRHSLARNVFHGKRGELYQRYREGQEDQLSALGLVVNIIVLWNTLYMDAVLNQLRAEGYEVRPEDEARLSPFGHGAHEHARALLFCRTRCRRPGRIAATPNRNRILTNPPTILKSAHCSIAPQTPYRSFGTTSACE
jgi:hypothetical protein